MIHFIRMEYYACPVCFYDRNRYYRNGPKGYCPCCGTSYLPLTEKECQDLRLSWISRGGYWFSRFHPKPKGWNWKTQVAKGLGMEPQVYL